MKKLILPVVSLIFFVLVFPIIIYAGNDEASPAAKSSPGYDPKCWNTHMVDQMAVCSKEHGSCANSCTKKDLKANALCLTECNNVLKVCYNKASTDYKICIEAEKQAKKQQETQLESKATQAPSKKPEIQNSSSESVNPFNIFAINPFEAWLKLKAVSDIPQLFEDVYVDIFYEHSLWGPGALEQLTIEDIYGGTLGSQFQSDSEPAITVKDEEEAWAFLPNYVLSDKENITVVKGQGQIKPPNSGQSVIVSNSSGDPPLFTTYADSIFTGSTSEMVTFRYTWGDKFGAVINVSPKTEVKILKPIQDKETQDLKRMVKLNKGKLEVKVKNNNPKNKFGVQTETLDLMVIGTHFWMSHDPDKKQTMVVAYEGKVEVKTKDGQTTIVTPNRDKPGVMVVTQKLSFWKSALAGLMLTAIIGVTVLILKKKFSAKGPNKKKK